MNTSNETVKVQLPRMLAIMLFSSVLFCGPFARAQLTLGGYLGPGFQTIVQGVKPDNFYKVHLAPQIGLIGRYHFSQWTAIRGGLSLESSGFKYQAPGALPPNQGNYWTTGRVDFAKVFVGASYAFPLTASLGLEGFADVAYGIPVYGTFKDRVNGKVIRDNGRASLGFFNHYLGMNLGTSLAWYTGHGFTLRFSPTGQFQFNNILGQDSPKFHFAGLVPRIEITFYIPKRTLKRANPKNGAQLPQLQDI